MVGRKSARQIEQVPSASDRTTSIVVSKNTDVQKQVKIKQFDEFRSQLDKMKTEFLEIYNEGHKRKFDGLVSLEDFDLLNTIGQGSFGSVVLGKHKATNKFYAIKVMSKARILKQNQFEHTMNEKRILCAAKFPFLVNMDFCFKDNCNIFFVLPFIAGGDMFSLLRRSRTFKEKDAKFYGAQVVLAIEYLHHMNILYRDLKPENIVLDVTGYIKLTDFGFCKLVTSRTYTLCGTPEYLAPEIILSKGYGKSVDWWSVGVFFYEMLAGFTPFYADEPMQIYEKITIGKFRFLGSFSPESRDLIRNMLQLDITRRFGILKDGVDDIKGHEWFKIIDWIAIYNRKMMPPYIPKVDSSGDTSHFEQYNPLNIQKASSEKYPKEFEDF